MGKCRRFFQWGIFPKVLGPHGSWLDIKSVISNVDEFYPEFHALVTKDLEGFSGLTWTNLSNQILEIWGTLKRHQSP